MPVVDDLVDRFNLKISSPGGSWRPEPGTTASVLLKPARESPQVVDNGTYAN